MVVLALLSHSYNQIESQAYAWLGPYVNKDIVGNSVILTITGIPKARQQKYPTIGIANLGNM